MTDYTTWEVHVSCYTDGESDEREVERLIMGTLNLLAATNLNTRAPVIFMRGPTERLNVGGNSGG